MKSHPLPVASRRVLVAGVIAALAVGLAAGVARYWLGYAVLIQGAACGGLVAWLASKAGRGGPTHPGFKKAFWAAWAFFLCFMAAQGLGFGLAQPWFEPIGWLGRVLDGQSAEFAFGVAATGGVHRGFAMGANGWFWLVLSSIDWAIMFFFMLALPWSAGGGGPKRSAKAKPGAEKA